MAMNSIDPKALAAEVASVLKQELTTRDVQITSLEQRLSLLEARPKSLDYQGAWQRAAGYSRNAAVTHKGCIWACLTDARGVEPGTAPACWQLAQRGDAR
jgi:hypothetical protein